MTLTITRASLLSLAIAAASVVVAGSNTAITLRASGATLTASHCNNAGVALVTSRPANVQTPGECLLSAPMFLQIVKSLPDDTISLNLGDNRLIFRCGRVTTKQFLAADGSAAPMLDMDATPNALTIPAANLRKLIDGCAFAIATDDNRYGLNGAKLEMIGDHLRMVATDGNRLSYLQVSATGTLAIGRRQLIPRSALATLRKMIGDESGGITLCFRENAALFLFPGTTLSCRLLEAEYPAYREVLPKGGTPAKVDRSELIEAVRRTAVLSGDQHIIAIDFGRDAAVLTARKLDAGDARTEVTIAYTGEPKKIGFNWQYLLDALNALDASEVDWRLTENVLAPTILTGHGNDPDDGLHVVMPVRLD